MKTMQWAGLKILSLTTCALFIGVNPSHAQTSGFRLKTADSLFVTKRYTQSFELYEGILKKNEYTPAMLLRMAFIQEGLGHIGRAMYYLNLYYIASRDKEALAKMEELATKYNLTGYKASDKDHFLSFYHQYYLWISISLAALCVLLLSFIFYFRSRKNKRPVVSLSMLVIILIGFSVHLYAGDKVASAIIISPNTYFMEGPSSAAPVLSIVGDGNRVEVIGRRDVWLKVQWDDQTGYVKENSVQRVEL